MDKSNLNLKELKEFLSKISRYASKCSYLANELEDECKYLGSYPIDITAMLESYDCLRSSVEALKKGLEDARENDEQI